MGSDTCAERSVEHSLRAAGLLGLSPRTYRRACRPPNGLESTFDDRGSLDGEYILAVPRGDPGTSPPIPDGTAISAIRTPPSVMGSNPRALRRPCTVGQTAVRVLTPYREFSTTVRATLAGQQENR